MILFRIFFFSLLCLLSSHTHAADIENFFASEASNISSGPFKKKPRTEKINFDDEGSEELEPWAIENTDPYNFLRQILPKDILGSDSFAEDDEPKSSTKSSNDASDSIEHRATTHHSKTKLDTNDIDEVNPEDDFLGDIESFIGTDFNDNNYLIGYREKVSSSKTKLAIIERTPSPNLIKAMEYIDEGNYEDLVSFLDKVEPENFLGTEFYDLVIYDTKKGSKSYDILLKYAEKWYPRQDFPKRLFSYVDINHFISELTDESILYIEYLHYLYGLFQSDADFLKIIKEYPTVWVRRSFINSLSKTFPYGPLSFAAIKVLSEIFAKGEFSPSKIEKILDRASLANHKRFIPATVNDFNKDLFIKWMDKDAYGLARDLIEWTWRIRHALTLDDFQEKNITAKIGSSNLINRIDEQGERLNKVISIYIKAQHSHGKNIIYKKLLDTIDLLMGKRNYQIASMLCMALYNNIESAPEHSSRVKELQDFFTYEMNKHDLDTWIGKFFPVSEFALYCLLLDDEDIVDIKDLRYDLRRFYYTCINASNCSDNSACSKPDSIYVNMLLTLPPISEKNCSFESYYSGPQVNDHETAEKKNMPRKILRRTVSLGGNSKKQGIKINF